ncbi:hypothetical protein Bca52824_082739 [Brassica carinata]|uniref:HUA2-like protein 3 n=1 Tax=Brassica carinata TaxID=52824 RepID=A0A8X7PKW0_BRACI|nr:hypothetical protein Bca52824_082739 [Brassica carinata]
MAPSRKRGGGKAAASARREWKVGDLVLAKVKGFPAWPAAVSEPDKWGYSADKKKVFVLFFGTQQIAFCNPADVESFTEEKKQSLLTKRHAKGSDFCVKEIAESFEKLKQQVEANDPKSADETTVGSSGNTIELPQVRENLIGTRLDTQIESNSSHGKDESTLLSEDASAAEQMLALRHNSLSLNVAAKDLCDTAIHSSKRRNETARSQKCAPQTIILPVQHSKLTSGLELDRLQRPLRQCSDGGNIVDDIDDGDIRRRKRIRPGHSESDDVVSSALNLHGSDEENASEIATVESDNNSRNEGNGVDSGSKVEHSDDVGEGCEGSHELSKGLDFQISTMVTRKKRKPTRKREANDLIDPPAKVEAEEGFGTKACDSCQGSENSHETLNERPCGEKGDEHLPLVKRARVRMSRVFCTDEKGNASSQLEERSSKDSPTSAAMQPSPSVDHENDIGLLIWRNLLAESIISLPEGNTRVSEVVQGSSEVSQTVNCLNIESDPIDLQCTRQNEKNGLPLNSDTVDSFANKPPSLCPDVQSQAVEHSQLFCSVVSNQEAENMQETENNLRIEKQVKEAEPQCGTVYSHCEDAEENKKLEKSCETDGQKEHIQATNSVSVSENLSPEKMRLTPDSPARGIPHSNSICDISTVESANGMQSNSYCCTSVQFGEKKTMSDDTVKEERKGEIGATEVKKVVISDVQFTIESFETALSSLVRTKETIGRATRLAVDLVKFGVSAKAMEILAHTLESESNLQRRVDLFFLVDSIAQCSKGLSVMLPRLLAAAVPAGATTQENRQQCLKVLKLWLERRILPESIVRHHIRELDSHSNVPACLYSRRSARTERALDDPVRDMEGMLVDEYGSNSTLQLDGFCIPAMLKVEDEGSDSDGEFESVTPEHESRILEEHVTPSITERHTRILEDVDGELEMEDVAPPWDVGSSAPTDEAGNTESANRQPVFGTSHQNVTSSSPLAPPSQNAQCAMSDSYSNGFDCRGYPSMHGDHQADIPRMNPPMHYRSPESSYSSRASLSKSMPHGEDSNFQHGPYPPPPPSHHYYPYMEPEHHRKPRREGPSYPHRSHYTPDFEERNYHDGHERMRPAACESRDNWRYHPSYSHGPRYHDRQRGPYQSSSHSGHHREYGRFENDRWSHSPHAYNNRHSFHYKPHSEGSAPVAMRDPPGTWHER